MNSQMPCNNSVISSLASATFKIYGRIHITIPLTATWLVYYNIEKAYKCYHRALFFFCPLSALRLLISSEMWSFCPSFNTFNYLRRHELWYLHFIYHLLIIQGLINSQVAPVMSFFFLSHLFYYSISYQRLLARMDSGNEK